MTIKILIAGDHFVRSADVVAALTPLRAEFDLEPAIVDLPWPVVPFGPVAEVDEASGSEDQILAAIDGAEVMLTQMGPVTARVLAGAPSLRLVCVTRGGPVNVNLDAARERGVTVCTTPGRNAEATAEHTVALLLAATRRLPQRNAELVAGQWRSDYYRFDQVGPEIHGSTVGLVGCGAVGSRVATVLTALGAQVVVYDPYFDASTLVPGVRVAASLDELLAISNVLTLHARLTPESKGMIGVRELALLPKGAVVVNAARGALVDETAVADALRSGHLFAAAFDVFAAEPLPADSPLRGAPNVVLTPHLAGATRQTAHRAIATAIRQVGQYLRREPVDHAI